MSPKQPEGQPLPGWGELPAQTQGNGDTPFSVYLHVPYCRVRCGYCDFNTYTNLEMGGGASASDYVSTLAGELRSARRAMDEAGLPVRPAETIFLGGGTPTMLPASDLARMIELVEQTWGIQPGAEITTEANPETVDEAYLEALAAAGFTRISVGMQSAVPEVLHTLDRTHRPEKVLQVIAAAKAQGLDTSLDLIYGTPGESMEDWQRSLDAALAMEPEHLSAYALVIEEGTRMWSQVRRGALPSPTDDDEAAKYEMADVALAAAGYQWYEISNWAKPGHECRHNEAYWRDWDWYGAGPGAHSHLGDVRLWNTKAPVAWAAQVGQERLPVAGHEVLDAEARRLEQVMLGIRMREGLPAASFEAGVVAALIADGYIDGSQALRGRVVLTLQGRLMADTVTHRLLEA